MSVTPQIPVDPEECRRLLADLLCRDAESRQQAEAARRRADDAQRRADDAQRRADELERILDQTAAEYAPLQQQYAELAETLALLRRYPFGQRRERRVDDPGQGHLFDIPEFIAEPGPAQPTAADDAAPPRTPTPRAPRRTRRGHLPHVRIELDLPESEKTCSCGGGPKHRIGEDESRVLDFVPAKLEPTATH
jgi:transposase